MMVNLIKASKEYKKLKKLFDKRFIKIIIRHNVEKIIKILNDEKNKALELSSNIFSFSYSDIFLFFKVFKTCITNNKL